jgi:hypothetical protein
MRPVLLLLLLAGLWAAGGSRQDQRREQKDDLANRVKSTPASKFDPSLPVRTFASWFAALVVPGEPVYDTTKGECEEPRGPEWKCVMVRADISSGRRIELIFEVSAESASFLHGTVGPADPRSKQPTRLIRKLSDLESMVK